MDIATLRKQHSAKTTNACWEREIEKCMLNKITNQKRRSSAKKKKLKLVAANNWYFVWKVTEEHTIDNGYI